MAECDHCGVCCKNPGIMSPKDIPKIAKRLGITIKDFIKEYCIISVFELNRSIYFAIAPVKFDTYGNRIKKRIIDMEYNMIKSRCIFHKNWECDIENVKPTTCKEYECWKMTGTSDKIVNYKELGKEWIKYQGKLRKLIPELENIKTNSIEEISRIFEIESNRLSIKIIE